MRIVDLFSGAGGLTFGFYYSLVNGKFVKNNNCEIVFANEIDDAAAEAFRLNYPDVNMIKKDIRELSEEEIRALIGEDEIDLIIGGPPCQSFSTVGKRIYDDKAKLYNEYYRILSVVRPRVFLFENVKGMLSMKDEKGNLIIDNVANKFKNINDNLGYIIKHSVLNAVNFGVPQFRERVFIVGIRNDLNVEWDFPEGVEETAHITLQEAISDLPILSPGQEAREYTLQEVQNDYQKLMRGNNRELTFHIAALHGKKIQTIINHVIPGEGKNYINSLVDQGILPEEYRLKSGYRNTYGRLVANKPCTTITKNLSTPSGLRCIHYDQNRALTPREGARIQSFPDWFQFHGSLTEVKTQIGNAVPPLLANNLAMKIQRLIE